MENKIIQLKNIQSKIFVVRGVQIILDYHLAEIYEVETKRLNEQVKRNIERFPDDFMFQLTVNEWNDLQSQIATTEIDNNLQSQIATAKRRTLPYAFTEQGVAMLSAVLKSEPAVRVSIQIIYAFVEMKKFITANAGLFQRLDKVEQKLIKHDENFKQLFKALENKSIKPKQDVFFNGQIFDAYTFVSDLIRSAEKSIILIDNYIDDTVLTHFTKRKKTVSLTIITKNISKQFKLDIKKYKEQYPNVELKEFKDTHDRFLIIDEKDVYHFGASLKDLGKKWFAFSKMNISSIKILDRLKEEELI